MGLRSTAHRVALGLAYGTRASTVWDKLHPGRAKVLMYHGVPERDTFEGVANYWGYNVPVREFEEQIRYLDKRCNVISLRDLMAGRLSRKKTNVVITFDDGYENNCTNAFEVLERNSLPAVFAIATSFVRDGKPLWNDVVEFAVNRTRKQRVRVHRGDDSAGFDLTTPSGRLDLYNWLMYQSVIIDQAEREAFLDAALRELDVSVEGEEIYANADYRPLSESQIAEMAKSDLVEFASHSVHHYLLAKMSRETKRRELRDSKQQIEQMTGETCHAFCVPGGSYDPDLLEEAFAAGYECVLTSDVGRARRGDRIINRNGVFRRELPWFADMVHGPIGDTMRWLRRQKTRLRARRGGNSR